MKNFHRTSTKPPTPTSFFINGSSNPVGCTLRQFQSRFCGRQNRRENGSYFYISKTSCRPWEEEIEHVSGFLASSSFAARDSWLESMDTFADHCRRRRSTTSHHEMRHVLRTPKLATILRKTAQANNEHLLREGGRIVKNILPK